MTALGTRFTLSIDDAAPSQPLVDPDEPKPSDEPPRSRERKARASRQAVGDTILAYNPFCPGCTSDSPSSSAVQPTTTDPSSSPAIATALPLALTATMEAEDPTLSLATVYDVEHRATGVFAVGETIRPGVVLVAVRPGAVELRNGQRLETLPIGGAKAQPRTERPVGPAAPKPQIARSSSALPGAEDAINCPSEGSCVVERKFVESLMADPGALASQAAVRPSPEGFAFGRVRPGTLPHLLGLQTGDVLTEVNGEALDSIDKVVALATKLRHASNLSVKLLRKGKSVQKEIRIA